MAWLPAMCCKMTQLRWRLFGSLPDNLIMAASTKGDATGCFWHLSYSLCQQSKSFLSLDHVDALSCTAGSPGQQWTIYSIDRQCEVTDKALERPALKWWVEIWWYYLVCTNWVPSHEYCSLTGLSWSHLNDVHTYADVRQVVESENNSWSKAGYSWHRIQVLTEAIPAL